VLAHHGVLGLVYDHDTRAPADTLTDMQHEHAGLITAALHVQAVALRIPGSTR